MGETINLVNNFKVENVIFNCGSYNYLEKELIKVLDKKNIKYYSCIKELTIDYKLSKYICYLIVQNANLKKKMVQ